MTDAQLFALAQQATQNAYAPYSKFTVGAALLCRDGSVFSGCNVENASYSLTMCAERVAVFTAVAQGHTDFEAIAVACAADTPCPPCGSCLQVLSQFASPDLRIVLQDGTTTLGRLLPRAFHPEELL